MCGICGIINYRDSGEGNEQRIRSMCRAMLHRGPDDEGIYAAGSGPFAGLGHRRLSIIDLSAHGHQPMANEDGSLKLVCNGEIYNYRSLREDLEARGHRFNSNSDNEVILHLYEEYGEELVTFLRGMFAFALYDEKSRKLVLARDRIGKKPLLYYSDDRHFCFASEFNALLSSGLIPREIDRRAIDHYLTFGYIPAPLTAYRNVRKLPPAHMLTVQGDHRALKKYWELDYTAKIRISEEDAAAEVLRMLKEAVGIRLCSDVALGAFLSGGIDSSAVVALMARVSGAQVKTFTIGFEEQDYSELTYARNIARMYATDHHEFIVKPDAIEVLPELVERYGEPYADSSCIPSYYVAKETKQFVTVALNGDGGDESFAGYERYQAMCIAENYRRFPAWVRGVVDGAGHILPDSINPRNRIRKVKRFLNAINLPAARRYLKWVSIFDDEAKKQLLSDDFDRARAEGDPASLMAGYMDREQADNTVDRLLMTDVSSYLPGDLLVKMDIASMARSLECRSPFLDHKLMEFCASLPAHYKLKGGTKKYILRKAITGLVPRENVERSKMGFGVPVGKWFRTRLQGYLRDIVLSPEALKRGYFKADAVASMVELHSCGKRDYSFQLWSLLMLELWHKRFIDRS
jgi:asparagine synthase (glutamine-hydrolysing)